MQNIQKQANLSSSFKSRPSRRSLRRLNKLLQKNLQQYKIPNPYHLSTHRNCNLGSLSGSCPDVPTHLRKQLQKLEFISIRSLHTLKFKQLSQEKCEEMNQILQKMRNVVKKQSEVFIEFGKNLEQRLRKGREGSHIEQKQITNNNDKEQKYSLKSYNQADQKQKQSSEYDQFEQGNLLQFPNGNINFSMNANLLSDNYEADKLFNMGTNGRISTGQGSLNNYLYNPYNNGSQMPTNRNTNTFGLNYCQNENENLHFFPSGQFQPYDL